MKKIALLGSTGSIGTSTLKVVEHLPKEFSIATLAAHSNIDLLAEQITQFKPELVAVFDETKADELQTRFPHQKIVSGEEGMAEAVSYPTADVVVMAIVGTSAIKPTIAAIEAGKTIGLASKEVLVSAGELITTRAREKNVPLIPIDSEHSALFQCLEGRRPCDVRRLILTASGGPFRSHTAEQLAAVTVEEALAHPTWNMGSKVTIDSSTLINKGLEMIEARWLFDMPAEKIDVVIHPQSVVHSMVEMIDGSILAQMSEPDMIFPIQYALTYPERRPGLFPPFDFTKSRTLDFYPPNQEKFRALPLIYAALAQGKSAACYLNSANEVLVSRFLRKEIRWIDIVEKLETLLDRHTLLPLDSFDAVMAVDHEARAEALAV